MGLQEEVKPVELINYASSQEGFNWWTIQTERGISEGSQSEQNLAKGIVDLIYLVEK